MRGVTRFVCRGLLTTALCLVGLPVPAQTPRYPSLRRDTWYEFLLKKCNPTDFDYGAWLEQRRKALLESTVREPRFWYSLSATAGLMLMIAAYAKLFLDPPSSIISNNVATADSVSRKEVVLTQRYCPGFRTRGFTIGQVRRGWTQFLR